MRILISPAKKMRVLAGVDPQTTPRYLKEAEEIRTCLERMSFGERKALWKCSDRIAEDSEKQLAQMRHSARTPAILAYEGIQYLYMDPESFTAPMRTYVQENLRILSGLYGVLRPFDGVVPYRLEMQARIQVGSAKNLYTFWGNKLYRGVCPEDGLLINLASHEYARAIWPYLTGRVRMITCVFGEKQGTRIRQQGVYAKMARGAMVRHLAQTRAESETALQSFSALDYRFSPEYSHAFEYVFLRAPESAKAVRPAFEWTETEDGDGIHSGNQRS
ncbi:MAG: peroxide stress protein YaaA [Clostridia bacterium]|nr:peroxide stress protein YaaA [Clostridia bacterium]